MVQEKINAQGQAHIANLRAAVVQLWKKMREEDGIPPESRFVVFSPTNKYAQFYNNAVIQLQEAEAAYKAGGYVGLKIRSRR